MDTADLVGLGDLKVASFMEESKEDAGTFDSPFASRPVKTAPKSNDRVLAYLQAAKPRSRILDSIKRRPSITKVLVLPRRVEGSLSHRVEFPPRQNWPLIKKIRAHERAQKQHGKRNGDIGS